MTLALQLPIPLLTDHTVRFCVSGRYASALAEEVDKYLCYVYSTFEILDMHVKAGTYHSCTVW